MSGRSSIHWIIQVVTTEPRAMLEFEPSIVLESKLPISSEFELSVILKPLPIEDLSLGG